MGIDWTLLRQTTSAHEPSTSLFVVRGEQVIDPLHVSTT